MRTNDDYCGPLFGAEGAIRGNCRLAIAAERFTLLLYICGRDVINLLYSTSNFFEILRLLIKIIKLWYFTESRIKHTRYHGIYIN